MATEKTGSLVEALLKAQSEMPEIGKDSKADTGKFAYKYASLPEILKVALPILHKNGLLLVQPTHRDETGAWLETTLIHTSGEKLTGETPLPTPEDWQKWGSAVTYARRYSLTAMLGIAPDDDDDASNAQGFSQAPRRASANGSPGKRNLASKGETCPEHGLEWRPTSRGNNAHPIKNNAGDLLGWCDEDDWKEAHEGTDQSEFEWAPAGSES